MEYRGVALAISLVFTLALIIAPSVAAAPFIVGFVNDSFSGVSADGYEITLWATDSGQDDNLTDIIGPSGNSGASGIYFIDCDLLVNGCDIGDEINVRVFNNGSDHVTDTKSLSITGLGFETMDDMRINSRPNLTLQSPEEGANFFYSNPELVCSVSDLDGNLANATLYGNWSGGWHSNETVNVGGASVDVNYTVNLGEGHYEWSCFVYDNLTVGNYAGANRSFTIDLTDPVISGVESNVTGNICGVEDEVRVNCSVSDSLTGIDTVIIEAFSPLAKANYSASLLSGDTYFADVNVNETGEWRFNCIANDSAGNAVNESTGFILEAHGAQADLNLTWEDIVFENTGPIENEPVLINATIHNLGCGDANNFLVGFFDGEPGFGGSQINGNRTISVSGLENYTTNVSWPAEIGPHNIYVSADLSGLISEANESDNVANRTIEVAAWQEFYGNVSIDKVLGDYGLRNLSAWFDEDDLEGNVFIADLESNIDWTSLLALGKNTTGDNSTGDFGDLDGVFGMEGFNDSVTGTFTSDGTNPRGFNDFFVHKNLIGEVPVVNSTNNTNFITGILWDSSDDTNGEFDSGESEDIVFIAGVSKDTQGRYGIYDYEIRFPVRIREQDAADSSDVAIYFDLD